MSNLSLGSMTSLRPTKIWGSYFPKNYTYGYNNFLFNFSTTKNRMSMSPVAWWNDLCEVGRTIIVWRCYGYPMRIYQPLEASLPPFRLSSLREQNSFKWGQWNGSRRTYIVKPTMASPRSSEIFQVKDITLRVESLNDYFETYLRQNFGVVVMSNLL